MAINIQLRRGTAEEWSTVNPVLALAEICIETDTNLFKIGNGIDNWNDLPYGGLRGYTGSTGVTGSVGNIAVENVLYVSKSGNDSNDGKSLNTSKLTIKSAVAAATYGTTILVKSGDYIEDNPILVPEGVAIVGDSLRTVIVRTANITDDLFWVKNGVYISQMTFKDHEAPSAAVAFPPDGSAGVIFTSPYVQNCTSITTTGTGMRVDGDHVSGLRSMVVDAFTQYNQGGIGIHMLNRGNTQLVSVFTICCDIGFLCESGGFCSITNSNSSFGNYALKSDGVSDPLYSGKIKETSSGRTFILDNLIVRPNVGDAVKFTGDPNYYTVATSTAFTPGSTEIVYPNFSSESISLRTARNLILDAKSKIQVDTIDYLNEKYPNFSYDQFKATRDAGIVIDSVVDDMVFNTNYRSVISGKAYYRASANFNLTNQKIETVDSLFFVKKRSLETLLSNYSISSQEYQRVTANFNLIIDTILNNTGAPFQNTVSQTTGTAGSILASNTAGDLIEILINVVENKNSVISVVNPDTSWVDSNLEQKFQILQSNKNTLKSSVTSWIEQNFPILIYDVETCERDVGLIIDAVGYDMMFGSNFKSIKAGMSYYRAQASLVIAEQKTATAQAFNYLKSELINLVSDNSTASNRIESNMNIIISIITNGLTSVPSIVMPDPTGFDIEFKNARDLLKSNLNFIKEETIAFIENTYPSLDYDQEVCARDVGYIVDAIVYDLTYSGNSETLSASLAYYSGNNLQIPSTERLATAGSYRYLKSLVEKISLNQSIGIAPDIIFNPPTNVDTDVLNAANILKENRSFLIEEGIAYITQTYPTLVYDNTACRRDIGFIVDAIIYDILYGGNSQTADVADEYFSGGTLQIPELERSATANTFNFIKEAASSAVIYSNYTPINTIVIRNTSVTSATEDEATKVEELFDIVVNIVENAYTSTITLEESAPEVTEDTDVTFHQYSLITASGHTFEWIGAGTNVNTALPYLGGTPIQENQVIQLNGGKVYFTGTDQRGDFRIGNDFVINQNTGTISGRTFTKSLFAVMTPYILAIGE
jgi:hypothetical protein